MDLGKERIEFDRLVSGLVSLGEDREELTFWSDIFETLDDDQKHELIANLSKELGDLESLSN
jgi:hypothetical protein